MKLLVVGITGDRLEVSTHFAMSLLKLQVEAAPRGIACTVTFAKDLNQALSLAAEAENDFDSLVAVDSRVSFPAQFAIAEGSPDFVVGVHPLPGMDWEAVQRAVDKPGAEPLHTAGLRYNVEPAEGEAAGNYVRVLQASLGAVKLSRQAVLKLALKAETSGNSKIFWREGIVDGVYLDKDAWLLKLWNEPVYADLANPCAYTGVAEFAGCVGQRQTLR